MCCIHFKQFIINLILNDMKEKCMQLKAIVEQIFDQNKEANALLMVESQGKHFAYVRGNELDLAADLACMMHETPGLDKVFRMAIEAHDNVPAK